MKPIEDYGQSITSYEGKANVAYENGETYEGHFSANQFTDGSILIGYAASERAYPDPNAQPSFCGLDTSGWQVTTNPKPRAINRTIHFGQTTRSLELVFMPLYLRTRCDAAPDSFYSGARFLISNFIWTKFKSNPPPIRFEAQGFSVAVKPVNDYAHVAARLRALKGIEATAEVFVENMTSEYMSLDQYTSFIDELVGILRLSTGNKVDWYFGEVLSDSDGEAVERLHKLAVTGRYSRANLKNEGLLRELIETCLEPGVARFDRSTLRLLIDYFVDACDETSYLEARGLLASTLVELVSAKYARANGAENAIPKSDFYDQVLPALEESIEETNIREDWRKHISTRLQGAYRQSFRKRLRLLSDDLDLPLNSQIRGRVVDIRNELVHEATFPSNRDKWLNDYQLLVWVDFIAICRLLGYKGSLPPIPS